MGLFCAWKMVNRSLRSRTLQSTSGPTPHTLANEAVRGQRDTFMLCAKYLSAHGKEEALLSAAWMLSSDAHPPGSQDEWVWITAFSTSKVQSVLCLDRQLEIGSSGCQHSRGVGVPLQMCSSLVSADCCFPGESGGAEDWGFCGILWSRAVNQGNPLASEWDRDITRNYRVPLHFLGCVT